MADLDEHLGGIAAGDPDAFERWVAGAEADLRRALRPFASAVDTEAVLQEALLRIWQVAPRVKPDGKPNALLRLAVTVSRNLALSESRRRRPDLDPEVLEKALTAEVRTEVRSGPDPFLRQVLQECREKLPGKPAQALMLRLQAAGGERDEALAAKAGMTLNTFLQNFTRARKFLAECLKGRGVDLDAELR